MCAFIGSNKYHTKSDTKNFKTPKKINSESKNTTAESQINTSIKKNDQILTPKHFDNLKFDNQTVLIARLFWLSEKLSGFDDQPRNMSK